MSKVRFEDYSKLKGSFPCIVGEAIRRTDKNLSDNANWHINIEIEHIVKGSGFVILDNKKTPVKAGDIVVINSGQIHYTGTDGEIVYDCIIIDDDFCRYLGLSENIRFSPIINDRTLGNKTDRLVAHYCNKGDELWEAKLSLYTIEILIDLAEKYKLPDGEKPGSIKNGDEVKQAILYICNNYGGKITLDTVAKQVLLDKYTLTRVFKKATNMTVFEYINNYRVTMAMGMLRSGKTVSEAAKMCGFNNMSFFTKIFKRYTGNLPTYYKNEKENEK